MKLGGYIIQLFCETRLDSKLLRNNLFKAVIKMTIVIIVIITIITISTSFIAFLLHADLEYSHRISAHGVS